MNEIEKMVPALRQLEGAGFEVRRPIPCEALSSLGPFILLDHIGPGTVKPGEAVGAPTHPHAGIETLSLFMKGGGQHKDSLGNVSVTGPGDVQWMRAGRGIVHDELPSPDMLRHGGEAHAVQLWLNMPGDTKFEPPQYRHLRASEFPVISPASGVDARVIAGSFEGQTGPLATFSSPLLVYARLGEGDEINLPRLPGNEYGLYTLCGEVKLGEEQQRVVEGELAMLAGGDSPVSLRAVAADTEILFLGGPPVTDKLVRYGPFVANSVAEMDQIIRDYQSGSFGNVP